MSKAHTLLVSQLLQREILLNASAQDIFALLLESALHNVNCSKLAIQEQNQRHATGDKKKRKE